MLVVPPPPQALRNVKLKTIDNGSENLVIMSARRLRISWSGNLGFRECCIQLHLRPSGCPPLVLEKGSRQNYRPPPILH